MKPITNQILQVRIDPLNYSNTLKQIKDWIVKKTAHHYICVAAVHLVVECQTNLPLLRGVNQAGLVTPDGMPLVWILRHRGFKLADRVYGPTLMHKTCQLAASNHYSIFLLGGSRGQTQQLATILRTKYPALNIVGYLDTPHKQLSQSENQLIIRKINLLQPNLVFVGLGCPYQELWMINNESRLTSNVMIGVGAAFDFITGKQKQAPPWLQNLGLEWCFRLIHNPRRLWKRYTLTNLKFIYLFFYNGMLAMTAGSKNPGSSPLKP
jgi:N-acetylglucosaminyldiphosphoundecaprenol N-acetyl-beta-D-mannosaminyltransferase